jgi:hypothetical protein
MSTYQIGDPVVSVAEGVADICASSVFARRIAAALIVVHAARLVAVRAIP